MANTDGPYYPPLSAETINEKFVAVEKMIRAREFPMPRQDLIIADYNTNKLIGRVSRYWISRETKWLALGISIYNPDNWGQGIGFEALGLWGEYLLNSMPDIARLDLRTWSGNIGMINLAQKLGFSKEACFRKARIVDGQYYDGLGFGILREEWQCLYPAGFADVI